MLCHTRHNHSPAWSEQWPGTASTVRLGPLPTSSAQPLEGDSGPPCTLSLTHWCVSWKRGVSPTTTQGTLLSPQPAGMCHQSWLQGVLEPWIGVQWNVWLYTYGLQTWSHSLLPIPVWHLQLAVNASLWCPGSVHGNRSPGHQQRVLWRCLWQYQRAAN